MKKQNIICACVVLVLAIIASLFLILRPQESSLFLQISKPVQFDAEDNITGELVVVLEDRAQTDIILLSMINAQPIPEAESPTSLPDGRIRVCYGGTFYSYYLWFSDDYIIFGNENGICRKIFNDHNNPVPLVKELVDSIR